MGEQESNTGNKQIEKIVIGILAHVDAGKTTLAESLLYLGNSIRKLGRVDNKDAFLDNHALERERGITIFAKQAGWQEKDVKVTLLDTPGHVDFAAEMERTLQVLDYAILVVSGADGVQPHTRTLWKLCQQYEIPTFIFVNKMDQQGTDAAVLMQQLKEALDKDCVNFQASEECLLATEHTSETTITKEAIELFQEEVAMCEEAVLEKYLESGSISKEEVVQMISERKVFPCFFGSALKMDGVDRFYKMFMELVKQPKYTSEFGAKVYKISHDEQGRRLTHMKITGGALKVRTVLSGRQGGHAVDIEQSEEWEEKVNQIRIYAGEKYEAVEEVQAGEVCAVTGLTQTYAGESLGTNEYEIEAVLEPVLSYQILLPPEIDAHQMMDKLQLLTEEDPQLHIVWDETLGEIQAQLMGEVQVEVLQRLIYDRFQVQAAFGAGRIRYKETIADTVIGMGHFEPLRHYAEVHLRLEAGERGSGMQFEAECSEDMLAKNWQRLILTHLQEKDYTGVLVNAPLTDIKITVIAGRAHAKHTEGGDFRQATYRAVRQGLMQAENVLLEPYYAFELELPTQNVGRALTDIETMCGHVNPPEHVGEMSVITGTAPVATMREYHTEVLAYTKGLGRLNCNLAGYDICHNAEEVIAQYAYDAENDPFNPAGSVFCSHGAGDYVPWQQVKEMVHVQLKEEKQEFAENKMRETTQSIPRTSGSGLGVSGIDDKELQEIFTRTYGESKREKSRMTGYRTIESDQRHVPQPKKKDIEEYLLVDGYNIIFAWEELNELAKVNLDSARAKLMDIMCNYQGYKKCHLILVFDAYKVKGFLGEVVKYHNIHVVYTKEAETADQYIEKTAHEIGRKYHVTVATSDGVEQVIVMGQGCDLLSAREFLEEVEIINRQIAEDIEKAGLGKGNKNYLFHHLTKEQAEYLEEVRLGRESMDE